MLNKNETNKVAILVVVGLLLALLLGGFAGGLMGNIFFGIAIFAIIFSGVFGKNALEKTGGISVVFTIGIIIATSAWGQWWQYVVAILVAIFIGNALSNHRPNSKQELLDYEHELRYDLIAEDDNFSIKFPKKPTLTKGFSRKMYQYRYKNTTSFNVSVEAGVEIDDNQDYWEELDSIYSDMKAHSNLEDIDYTKTEIQGVPCIRALLRDGNSNMLHAILFIKSDKSYIVSVGIVEQDDDLFNRFIGSFTFLGK